jgi:hypothetical protein
MKRTAGRHVSTFVLDPRKKEWRRADRLDREVVPGDVVYQAETESGRRLLDAQGNLTFSVRHVRPGPNPITQATVDLVPVTTF